MQRVRAKKSLGQHFLRDLNVAQQIADSLQISDNQVFSEDKIRVLEVGPGMGVLTQFLLQNPRIELTAIELDRESVDYLKVNFPQLHLIHGDFLKLDLNVLYPDGNFCVIGNYPYNISSQIFFKVLQYKDKVPCCSGMIQKEVAERLAAKPKNKSYGILSVLMQTWYDIEYLFTVHEYVFDPPPKVKSAVVRFTRNRRKEMECNEQLFIKVVKTSFNQRRKQMRNSLQVLLGKGNSLLELPIMKRRPEELSVEEFIGLTNLIEKHNVGTQNIL